MATRIFNPTPGTITLPPPYGQMLTAGSGVVIEADEATIIEKIGGLENLIRSGLQLQQAPSGSAITPNIAPATSSGSIVWHCGSLDAPDGAYVTTWADAVAAVQAMPEGADKAIVLWADPDNDSIAIPGGTWNLNGAWLVGQVRDSDTDSNYRGWQELLPVAGSGDSASPTWLQNCGGLRDLWFRSSFSGGFGWSGSDLTIVSVNGSLVTARVASGPAFVAGRDEGKAIRIGSVGSWPGNAANTSSNNGTFYIESIVDDTTFTFHNYGSPDANDDNNGDIGWSVCTSTFMFLNMDGDNAVRTRFNLDNCDFRYGYDWTWGSLYISENVDLFLRMERHASTRWFGISCDGFLIIETDGFLIIETDGSACWIGNLAFAGNGNVHTFPMAGTEIHTNQPAIDSWTDHQPITHYIPNNGGNWNGPPDTVHAALDEVAGRVKSAESAISGMQGNISTLQSDVAALAYAKPLVIHIGTAGAQPVNPASETTRDIMIVADTSAAGNDITTTLGDGGFTGQTVTLIMGPMGGGKTWAVTPTHGMWFTGTTITFDGLAQAAVLRWYGYGTGWCIQSTWNPASPPAKPAIA